MVTHRRNTSERFVRTRRRLATSSTSFSTMCVSSPRRCPETTSTAAPTALSPSYNRPHRTHTGERPRSLARSHKTVTSYILLSPRRGESIDSVALASDVAFDSTPWPTASAACRQRCLASSRSASHRAAGSGWSTHLLLARPSCRSPLPSLSNATLKHLQRQRAQSPTATA